MKKRTNVKILCLAVSLLLLLSVPLAVFGVGRGTVPDAVGGKYVHLIENRIDFTVDNTSFTCTKSGHRAQTFLLTLHITAQKGEADIYGVLNSIDIVNLNYNSVTFTPDAQNNTSDLPNQITLYDTPVGFTVEISVDTQTVGTLYPTLQISYRSGLSPDTVQDYILDVPLTVNIVAED